MQTVVDVEQLHSLILEAYQRASYGHIRGKTKKKKEGIMGIKMHDKVREEHIR